jgi:hypothetical protein
MALASGATAFVSLNGEGKGLFEQCSKHAKLSNQMTIEEFYRLYGTSAGAKGSVGLMLLTLSDKTDMSVAKNVCNMLCSPTQKTGLQSAVFIFDVQMSSLKSYDLLTVDRPKWLEWFALNPSLNHGLQTLLVMCCRVVWLCPNLQPKADVPVV